MRSLHIAKRLTQWIDQNTLEGFWRRLEYRLRIPQSAMHGHRSPSKRRKSAGAIGAVHECLVVTSCPRRQLRAKEGKNSPLSDPFAGSIRNKAFSSLFPS